MKKFILLVLVTILLAAAAGCAAPTAAPAAAPANTTAPANPPAPADTAAPAQPAASGSKPIIALALPAMDNPLMLGFKDTFLKAFGGQYDVQVVSADGNPNTQATQVENFIGMKPKFMFIFPAEASSLVPKMIEARKAGIPVLTAGGDPGNADAYDSVMLTNQYLAGLYEAYMAKQWVDKTYSDAKDGSIETAVFISSLSQEAIDRSNGMKMIAEPYLKNAKGEYIDANGKVVTEANRIPNPAYSSKVKVVQTPEAEMFQAGQTAMQNVLTTNPDVKLVLAYAGDGGMGASKAILDEYAKGEGVSAIDDLNKVAVFGVGMIGAEGPAVLDSANNKSVFRGTIRFGGDLHARTVEVVQKMLQGDSTKVIFDPLDIVTVIDGKLMSTPIESSEYFTIPTAQPVEVKLGPPPG
jgi:ribose transport system substrate-binding protein